MANLMSLDDYYNILDYHDVRRQSSIYKSKKMALELMNRNMCVCHLSDRNLKKIRNILTNIKSKSKNKKNYNLRTIKNNDYMYLMNRRNTRNLSPISLMFNYH